MCIYIVSRFKYTILFHYDYYIHKNVQNSGKKCPRYTCKFVQGTKQTTLQDSFIIYQYLDTRFE